MNDFSVLIGGKAGEGINQAGALIGELLRAQGYFVHIYFDYPSLIRGGHNFAIIRASQTKVSALHTTIDYLLALNNDAIVLHKDKLHDASVLIYDSEAILEDSLLTITQQKISLQLSTIIKESKAPIITKNTAIIGSFCRAIGISEQLLKEVIVQEILKETELNQAVALKGYESSQALPTSVEHSSFGLPFITGNEAVSYGLIEGGLDAYVAYPMTPASSVLHTLAAATEEFSLKVVHPENEISVILLALGFSYTGQKVAVGTSGGGFCLMTEGLSLAGISELPVVIVMSQRPGPSTGIPTYSTQADFLFVLNAGHGEFVRFVVAPGDAEQAYYYSNIAMQFSCKHKVPAIVLMDKLLSESSLSFDIDAVDKVDSFSLELHNNVVMKKANSYVHDKNGITTEESAMAVIATDQLLEKAHFIIQDYKELCTVETYGLQESTTAILCWGSNKGVCKEVGERLGLKVIQPIILSPFPIKQFLKAIESVKKIIAVESNAQAQLVQYLKKFDIKVDKTILQYDGRPFTIEELEERVKGCTPLV